MLTKSFLHGHPNPESGVCTCHTGELSCSVMINHNSIAPGSGLCLGPGRPPSQSTLRRREGPARVFTRAIQDAKEWRRDVMTHTLG